MGSVIASILKRRPARTAMALLVAFSAMAGAPEAAWATEFGVYRGPGCKGRERIASFEAFAGRKVERTVDALNWFGTWNDLTSSIPWVISCWKGSGRALTLSVPMLPMKEGGTLADGAAGKHDKAFTEAGLHLIANGYHDAVIRIGWEFNGNWMPWRADKDPENYVKYFQRIVILMRSLPGQRFKFEWTPNHGRHAIDATKVYPGDAYVDVIGMDVYDEIWTDNMRDPVKRWAYYRDQPFGLAWHRDFAKSHGKPLAYSEWGVGQRPDGHGSGDNPYFVKQMAAWFAEVKPLYQSYWDDPSPTYDAELSEGGRYPQSSAMFRTVFGAPK